MKVVVEQFTLPNFDRDFFVPIAIGTGILLAARPVISMIVLKCLQVNGLPKSRVRNIVQLQIEYEENDPKQGWATVTKIVELGAYQLLVATVEELIFRVPTHYLGKHFLSKGARGGIETVLIVSLAAHLFSVAHNKHHAWFRDYFWSGEYSLHLLAGFVFSSVYARTNSLFASILTHAFVNMVVLSPPYGSLNVMIKKKIYSIK